MLVRRNIRFVLAVASKFSRDARVYEDLVAEGLIGLIYGIRRFDCDRVSEGTAVGLGTYVTPWIKNQILRARSSVGPCRHYVPVDVRRAAFREINRAMRGEIALEPEAYPARLWLAIAALDRSKYASLSTPIGDGAELEDVVEDLGIPRPDEEAERGGLRARVRELLDEFCARCSPRDRDIVRFRIAAHPDDAWTLDRLGRAYGLTRERVRQIEADLVKKLRRFLERNGIAEDMSP